MKPIDEQIKWIGLVKQYRATKKPPINWKDWSEKTNTVAAITLITFAGLAIYGANNLKD